MQVFKNENDTDGELYLAYSNLNLAYYQTATIYKKRWGVVEYNKSIKSNTGFAKSPTITIKTQTNYFFLAAQKAAYIELKILTKLRKAKKI